MINQNLKILHNASFFLSDHTVLHYYSLFLLRTSSYCIKKVYLKIILLLWLASHFTEKLEQIRTHIPYFYFAFSFSVIWSSPVEQLI